MFILFLATANFSVADPTKTCINVTRASRFVIMRHFLELLSASHVVNYLRKCISCLVPQLSCADAERCREQPLVSSLILFSSFIWVDNRVSLKPLHRCQGLWLLSSLAKGNVYFGRIRGLLIHPNYIRKQTISLLVIAGICYLAQYGGISIPPIHPN